MAKPLLSVVMPVKNGAAYLDTAIESILSQTFSDFELLIIDNGSADESLVKAVAFQRQDRRVRVMNRAQSGLSEALNFACNHAQASLIARMDADDFSLAYRFETQMAMFRHCPNLALLGTAIRCVDANGTSLFEMIWPRASGGLRDYLLLDCCICHPTVMFRKRAFDSLGGYRSAYKWGEDFDLFLRFSEKYDIDNSPEILLNYRLHDRQVSKLQAEQQIYTGIGARLATRARRAHLPEPVWPKGVVNRDDLLRLGVSSERLQSLIQRYEASKQTLTTGWRWAKGPLSEGIRLCT